MSSGRTTFFHILKKAKEEKEMFPQHYLVGKVNSTLAWDVHLSILNRASCMSHKSGFCLQNYFKRDMMAMQIFIQICSWIESYCKGQI